MDLGFSFDAKLKFANHIRNTTSAAGRLLGFITRASKQFRSMEVIKLYYSFVRSTLEYGTVAWSPMYLKYITEIECCQRKFLKFLVYKLEGRCPDRGSANLSCAIDLSYIHFRKGVSTLLSCF